MRCGRVQKDLVAYHDGALHPSTTARLERHLVRCQDCAAAARRLGRAVEQQRRLLRQAFPPEPAPDPAVLAAARRQITDRSLARGRGGLGWRPVWVAVPAAAAIVWLWVGGWIEAGLIIAGFRPPPSPVAVAPEFYRDFPMFERLELLEQLDVLVRTANEERSAG